MEIEGIVEQGTEYIDWLGAERPLVLIEIDTIFCKHESRYDKYRNAYRNQLIDMLTNPDERFIIERERNKRLMKVLEEKGKLYPIALHYYEWKEQRGYICIDGHHRITAYLASRHNYLPGIIYKTPDEAGLAKHNAPHTDYFKDLMRIDKEIGA